MIEKFHFHRFEFKYIVDRQTREKMIKELLNYMERDVPFDEGETYYEILNLYLDSQDLRFYREKIDGLMFRRKMRFRFYTANPEEQDHVFMEIKRKRNMTIIKDRVKLGYDEAKSIARCSFGDIIGKLDTFPAQEKEILSEFVFEAMKNRLNSKLWVNYKRTAFKSKNYPSMRITFDDDILSTRARDGFGFHVGRAPKRLFKDRSILEVKYNGTLPFWVHNMIRKHQLFREPISKYCNAVEGLLF